MKSRLPELCHHKFKHFSFHIFHRGQKSSTVIKPLGSIKLIIPMKKMCERFLTLPNDTIYQMKSRSVHLNFEPPLNFFIPYRVIFLIKGIKCCIATYFATMLVFSDSEGFISATSPSVVSLQPLGIPSVFQFCSFVIYLQ